MQLGDQYRLNLWKLSKEKCQTFREACQKLGLLDNDQHWDTTMWEASFLCFPAQLRGLFAIILRTCGPSNPKTLWDKYKESLSEDVLLEARRVNHTMGLNFIESRATRGI
jgi:hypothetical protein